MIEITGMHIPGGGGASQNLPRQLPLIAKYVPEVLKCRHGTINLRLPFSLFVLLPDVRTPRINWEHPSHPNGEVFDLLEIMIEAPKGTKPERGWIYVAHDSPHRATPDIHEIIAPDLATKVNSQCLVRIAQEFVDLPPYLHRHFPSDAKFIASANFRSFT